MKDYLKDLSVPLPIASLLNDIQLAVAAPPSWYCEPCAVEVHERRCPHCGKTERELR